MALEIRGLCPLLQVFDMETSIRFYCDVLGFEIGATSKPSGHFGWALLRLERPPAPDAARVSAHDDTTIYFGCPDVDAAYEHLRNKGLDVKRPKIAPYGMKQLYLHDPDGYNLCFQWAATEREKA